MPVSATEFDIAVPGPEVVPAPTAHAGEPGYPQVQLAIGQGAAQHRLSGIQLENDCLRVYVCTSLGGRILGLFDKRSDTWAIPLPEHLDLKPGGTRGIEFLHGVEFLCGPDHPDRLGPVDFRIVQPEGAGAAVFLFGWFGDQSWHGAVTLSENGASVVLEQKLLNRSWHSRALRGGVLCQGMGPDGVWEGTSGNGFALIDSDGALPWKNDDTWATLPPDGRLGGRRADAWKVHLIPFTGLGKHLCSGQSVSAGMDDQCLTLQTHKEVKNATVFLSVAGETLESRLDSGPSRAWATPLGEMAGKIDGILVRGGDHSEITRWPAAEAATPSSLQINHFIFDQLVDSDAHPAELSRIPGLEAFAAERSALQAFAAGDNRLAEAFLERYLAYNAEDPLGWWLIAAMRRESGKEPGEGDTELPNAHYLAPLEPLLKAEAFLNTPQAQGKEPNPLLASVADCPSHAAGVVGLYLRFGVRQGAARLADELLRHQANAMIHYLLAAALAKTPNMAASAAEQVARAEALPVTAPFPDRPEEREAIQLLSKMFPDSKALQRHMELMGGAPR